MINFEYSFFFLNCALQEVYENMVISSIVYNKLLVDAQSYFFQLINTLEDYSKILV